MLVIGSVGIVGMKKKTETDLGPLPDTIEVKVVKNTGLLSFSIFLFWLVGYM